MINVSSLAFHFIKVHQLASLSSHRLSGFPSFPLDASLSLSSSNKIHLYKNIVRQSMPVLKDCH